MMHRLSDFPKLAEKLSVIRTDRHEEKYFAGPKKKPSSLGVAIFRFFPGLAP